MLNGGCGTAAVLLSMRYVETGATAPIVAAFALLPLGLALDFCDGAVARRSGRSSALGGDLDSLADLISFGVAPAAIAYAVGMRGLWDGVALTFFVACGVARLARYNVTAAELTSAHSGKVTHYEGTPIPSSVLLVLMLAVAFATGRTGDALWLGDVTIGFGVLHPLSLLFVLNGATMASATLRIPKP